MNISSDFEDEAQPGPALIDFHLDETQNVYPMMLPGRGLSDMVERGPEEPEA
ncbi:MAG TPA: hypothetical protein VJ506_04980 [Candidatus Limnocylindrales bacterium]|nr:hypothetical protein [Candidatus Limnocylindrales bacterium]